jgi:nucleotide-binding universal stress UspA family protein
VTSSDLIVRHVLVPLDGSDFASAALPTGRALAKDFGAELRTCNLQTSGDAGEQPQQPRLGVFDRVFRRQRLVADVDGSAEAIARRVEELGDCLVCLSAPGRGRVLGAVAGSVAEALLRRSPHPIVVLGPFADRPGWSPSPRWPTPLSSRQIVACVDGSAASELAIPAAAAWARALDLEMTILTVADDLVSSVLLEAPTSRYGRGRDAGARDAGIYIEELVDRWRDEAPQVTGRVVTSPIGAAEGVRAYLDAHAVGLVVLSTAARSGVQRVLHGATGAAIVRASTVPCLVVPVGSATPVMASPASEEHA